MPIASGHFARAVRRIDALADERLPTQQLIESVADELQAAMPVDALVMAATDPDTSLALGAGVVRDMPHTVCLPFWEYEFEVPDFNKFSDLARAPRQVADLHAATGGRPERSARWREFRTLLDADAELRATFTAGGRGWGLMHLNRAGTTRGFSVDEVAFVETIVPIVGRALRLSLISHPASNVAGRGPGMAIVDAENRLMSATPEALEWFEEIESIYPIPDPVLGRDVPSEVTVAAREARARATASFDGAWAAAAGASAATRTRARTRNGVWLLIHASCLQRPDGTASEAAVVIEPAKASEVAPLIVDAYELTPREVDVTRALARGLSTNEIAAELHLSRYTVQDHLKSVYEKAGVSSRGELVAKMFADHYHDGLAAAIHGPVDAPPVALAAAA
jgi:DNA-binding CsgD family transcriptional regulator